MPGPGGGSHGGGFSGGGGFHSGGFSGGSRGGGYRGGYRGGFFFGPRFYYGGCLGPFFGWFFGPIIMLSLVAIIFFFVLVSSIASIGSKDLVYDESKFQKYAGQAYAEQFAAGEGYEDHILIVFLTEENAKNYHCTAWVGNDIHYKINEMFGDENTPFGKAMRSSINDTDYTYQLTAGLSMAVEKMQDRVTDLGLSSSFRCNETHVRGASHMVNRTDYTINETTVNGALQNFTDATGIEIVIMVDEGSHVFDRVSPVGGFLALAVLLVIIAFLVWIIVRNVKNKKNKGSGGNGAFNGNPRTDNSDPYGNDNW